MTEELSHCETDFGEDRQQIMPSTCGVGYVKICQNLKTMIGSAVDFEAKNHATIISKQSEFKFLYVFYYYFYFFINLTIRNLQYML